METDNGASRMDGFGPVKGKRSFVKPKISKKWAIGIPVAAALVGFGLYEAGAGSNNTEYHITDRQIENGCLESFSETGFGRVNTLEVKCADGTSITIIDKNDDLAADLVRIISGNSEAGYTPTTYKATYSKDNEQKTYEKMTNEEKILYDATNYMIRELGEILTEKTSPLRDQIFYNQINQ